MTHTTFQTPSHMNPLKMYQHQGFTAKLLVTFSRSTTKLLFVFFFLFVFFSDAFLFVFFTLFWIFSFNFLFFPLDCIICRFSSITNRTKIKYIAVNYTYGQSPSLKEKGSFFVPLFTNLTSSKIYDMN